jgi:hypothetical protein
MTATIHVVQDDSFDDWVVRDDSGREFGHYPTRETAELVPVQRYWLPKLSPGRAEPKSSFIFPTEERTARTSQRGLDGSRDERRESALLRVAFSLLRAEFLQQLSGFAGSLSSHLRWLGNMPD